MTVHYDPVPGFGETLATFREARKVSQSRLALRAGFDHSYISRLERGTRFPTREAIHAIARALELPPNKTARLIIAAGFLPDDAADVLTAEPAVAQLYTALTSDRLPDDVKDRIRSQVVLIVEQAAALTGGTA